MSIINVIFLTNVEKRGRSCKRSLLLPLCSLKTERNLLRWGARVCVCVCVCMVMEVRVQCVGYRAGFAQARWRVRRNGSRDSATVGDWTSADSHQRSVVSRCKWQTFMNIELPRLVGQFCSVGANKLELTASIVLWRYPDTRTIPTQNESVAVSFDLRAWLDCIALVTV